MRAAGVGVLLDVTGPGLPSVLHWGADPGPLDEAARADLAAAAARRPSPRSGLDDAVAVHRCCRASPTAGRAARAGRAPRRAGAGPGCGQTGPPERHGRRRRRAGARLRAPTRRRASRCVRQRAWTAGGLLRVRHAVTNTGTDAVRPRRRCARACCRCRPGPTSCWTSPVAGAASARRSGSRFAPRHAAAGEPARAHRARRDPAAGGRDARVRLAARRGLGRARRRGAATTCTSPSGCPRAPGGTPASSAAASCCCPARSGSRPGETTRTPWVVFACVRRRAGRALDAAAPLAARRDRGTRAGPVRSCSTPGRPCTSTTDLDR